MIVVSTNGRSTRRRLELEKLKNIINKDNFITSSVDRRTDRPSVCVQEIARVTINQSDCSISAHARARKGLTKSYTSSTCTSGILNTA